MIQGLRIEPGPMYGVSGGMLVLGECDQVIVTQRLIDHRPLSALWIRAPYEVDPIGCLLALPRGRSAWLG